MNTPFRIDSAQRKALAVAMALAVVAAFFFLHKYIILIILAAIVAYVFNPIYLRLVRKGRRPGTAAVLTLLLTLLTVIIPLTLVLIITSYQVVVLIDAINTRLSGVDLGHTGQQLMAMANNLLSTAGVSFQITPEYIRSLLAKAAGAVGHLIVENAWSSFSSVLGFITLAIIYLYVFLSLLKNQQKIMRTIHDVNPLGNTISTLYFARMGSMTKAMVKGHFLIAFLQGLTGAALIYIAGIHTAFVFFAVVLTALSLIPLGGGILALPLGVIMLFTGNIPGGLIVILGHLLIVTNIDNILRPMLVPKDARLDPALTLLSVFAGLGLFGFIGIILGPVIMIVLVTTLQVYLEVFKGRKPEVVTVKKSKKSA